MSFMSKREAAAAIPGCPGFLPAWQGLVTEDPGEAPFPETLFIQANREETVEGQVGENLDVTLAGGN